MRENNQKTERMKSANKALFELTAGACKWKNKTDQTDNKNDKEIRRTSGVKRADEREREREGEKYVY